MPEERRQTCRNKFLEGGFNPTLTERRLQPRTISNYLKCVNCARVTTPLEATLRVFRTGKCGHCGGALENWA